MHHAKNRGNKEIPLAIISRILVQSCVTLCLNYVGRVTHDCASILDIIAKGISLFPRFFAWCIPTSTSGKIIQLNEYGCRDAPCEKSWKQGYPLSNNIKDISTIMRNPLPELCREGLRMIVLVSLILLLRGYPCFHDFSHGASLHPYSFN